MPNENLTHGTFTNENPAALSSGIDQAPALSLVKTPRVPKEKKILTKEQKQIAAWKTRYEALEKVHDKMMDEFVIAQERAKRLEEIEKEYASYRDSVEFKQNYMQATVKSVLEQLDTMNHTVQIMLAGGSK